MVDAPAHAIYDRWARMEEFPRFMPALHEVKRVGPDRFYWRVERGGREFESIMEIVLRIPARRMAWRTVSGVESSGVVGFDHLADGKTLISFEMKYVPNAGWGDRSELLHRIERRLANFKAYVESLSEIRTATPQQKGVTA